MDYYEHIQCVFSQNKHFVHWNALHDIGTLNYEIALTFDRRIGSSAGDVPVKFQSDGLILNTILTASKLCKILQEDVSLETETGARFLFQALQLIVLAAFGVVD